MLKKYFYLIFQNFLYRRLRTFLTILGIIIGSSLILSLFFLGKGMENAVLKQLRVFSTDAIFVYPGEATNPFLGFLSGVEFREKDLKAVEGIEGVRFIVPIATGGIEAKYRGENTHIIISGLPLREGRIYLEESQGMGLKRGYWAKNENEKAIILGHNLAEDGFKEKPQIGDEIILKEKKYTITGILKETGDPSYDGMGFISLKNFRGLTGNKLGVNMFVVKLYPGANERRITQEIENRLRERRGLKDFAVVTAEKAASIIKDILLIIQIVIITIAVTSLVVGGIGITNTMSTAVLERVKEIGIMKAVGAKNYQIVLLFLLESGFLGSTGGIIGGVIGIFIPKLIETIARSQGFLYLDVHISFVLILEVLIFTFFFGVISGIYPAYQAARLLPTEALRAR